MSMRAETRQSMEMLFAAKWNLPKAAKNANQGDESPLRMDEDYIQRIVVDFIQMQTCTWDLDTE